MIDIPVLYSMPRRRQFQSFYLFVDPQATYTRAVTGQASLVLAVLSVVSVGTAVEDQTWNDLNLNDVCAKINRTLT
jgi:hypothetical protein